MKYLLILTLVTVTSCLKIDPAYPDSSTQPDWSYLYADPESEIQRITDLIGDRKYVVKSIVDAAGVSTDSLYPGFLGTIYSLPAKRIDSIGILTKSKFNPSFKMDGWNIGVDVGSVRPDGKLKVTGIRFPIYDIVQKKFAMKTFVINLQAGREDYKIDNGTGAITLVDYQPFGAYTITLVRL